MFSYIRVIVIQLLVNTQLLLCKNDFFFFKNNLNQLVKRLKNAIYCQDNCRTRFIHFHISFVCRHIIIAIYIVYIEDTEINWVEKTFYYIVSYFSIKSEYILFGLRLEENVFCLVLSLGAMLA